MRERRMTTVESMAETAAELRRAFDATFAAPPSLRPEETDALLIVRAAADWRVALRVAELGGIYKCPPILRLPGGSAAQLGIVGLRGRLTVAVSLAAALGRERPGEPGQWLALWGADRSVGFVFAGLDTYARVGQERIRRRGEAEGSEAVVVEELAQLDGGAYPIVNTAALLAKIRAERGTGV